MSEKRMHEPFGAELTLSEINNLPTFDRITYRYGRLLQVTGGITLKSTARAKQLTKTDIALNALAKEGAVNYDTGKSASQLAKVTGYGRVTMSQALNELYNKKLIESEQRGRQIRYWLPNKNTP